MNIKIKKLHKDAKIPEKVSYLAGGWDVTCTEIQVVEEDFVICKLGFALEIPKGYRVILVPRSSFTKYKWILQNSPGLGDADYTGEYQYRFRALPIKVNIYNYIEDGYDRQETQIKYDKFPYKVGDRIGQIYLEEVIEMEFEEVEELSTTERGEGGYGSTGN